MKTCKYLAEISVITVMLVSATPVEAQCMFPLPSRSINDPYDYTRTIIDSLSFAHQANSWVKSGSAPEALLYGLQRARNDYMCAAYMVEKFQSSADMFIKMTAPAVYNNYDAMSQLYQKNMSALTQLLDQVSKSQTPPLGSTMNQFADLAVIREEGLELVGQAIVQSTYSLLEWTDQTPQGKPTGRLRITESQRQNLMTQIEKAFGSATVRSGPRAGPQPTLEVAAIALYQWLSDRKWRSADSK